MPLITKVGYAYLGLKPSELWELSTREFVDMYDAHITATNEDVDNEMQRTSWFTALLMNATGNFKKQIQPNKLYVPLDDRKPMTEEDQRKYVETQQEELKRKFNIE